MQKKWCTRVMLLILSCVILLSLAAGCGSGDQKPASQDAAESGSNEAGAPAPEIGTLDPNEKVTLRYSYWGSAAEDEMMRSAAQSYMDLHPNVTIEPLYIPNADYSTKMAALVASKDLPDICNMFAYDVIPWAQAGAFVDIYEMYDQDPNRAAEDYIPYTFFEWEDGKCVGRRMCAETMIMYYNRDIFEACGVDPLPTDPNAPLSWDAFVETCKKLTLDENGNNALSPDFDDTKITQYAFDMTKTDIYYTSLLYNNGGSYLNEDNTFGLNSDIAVDTIQRIADLMTVEKVMLPATIDRANMSATSSMESGQVAMLLDGSWSCLDFSKTSLNWGVGVLPRMNDSVDYKYLYVAGLCSLASNTKHLNYAWDFYCYLGDPSAMMDIYTGGLWLPIIKEWYTDSEKLNTWASVGGAHPEGFQPTVLGFLDNAGLAPQEYVLNFSEVDAVVTPALQNVWTGAATASDAMNGIKEQADSLIEGAFTIR